MQTALDYLLERFLGESNRVSEADAKTTEVRTGPTDDLTSSDHNDHGSPREIVEEELTSHEEEQSGTPPASHGEEGSRASNVSPD